MVNETISSQYCNLHSYTMWLAVLFMWRASMYETTAELYYYLMLSNGLSNLQTNATKLQSFGFKMSKGNIMT